MSDEIFAPTAAFELEGEHRAWIVERLRVAGALAGKYAGVSVTGELPALELVEQVYQNWRREPPRERESNRSVLEALAAVIGEHLARVPGLRWVIVKDEYGSDYAIYGTPGELLVYPLVTAFKRFEAGEPLGAVAMVQEITRRWQELSAAWGDL